MSIRAKKLSFLESFHRWFSLCAPIWIVGGLCDLRLRCGDKVKNIKVHTTSGEDTDITVRWLGFSHGDLDFDPRYCLDIYWRKLWFWRYAEFDVEDLVYTYKQISPFASREKEAKFNMVFAHGGKEYQLQLSFENMQYTITNTGTRAQLQADEVQFNNVFFDL